MVVVAAHLVDWLPEVNGMLLVAPVSGIDRWCTARAHDPLCDHVQAHPPVIVIVSFVLNDVELTESG